MILPSDLQNKITALQEKLPAVLDDFKKYYVFFNKNPTYSEYQTIYENLTSNLNSITNELLTITNDVEQNTITISNDLLKINQLIEKIFKQSFLDKKPINCIINNAGVRLRKSFLNIGNNDLKKVFDINFFSIFKISQIFIQF